jgi:peptidoglycan/xylan/chitin deacetylase (PgdA/CDA1 family)
LPAALKIGFEAILRRSPAQPIFLWRAGRRLTVLAYHGIDAPDLFERHLDHLCRKSSPISLDDLLAFLSGGRGLPERAVLITFDDGHPSVHSVARPLLRERGLPGVAFVVAGLIGTDQPFWWEEVEHLVALGGSAGHMAWRSAGDLVARLKRAPDQHRLEVLERLRASARGPAPVTKQLTVAQLRELEADGIMVGNHSLTHACLDTCSMEKTTREVFESHRILSMALGHPPSSFAYPNGNWSADVRDLVRKAGYRVAFAFDHRSSQIPPPDPLTISRVRVNSTTSLDRLALILSGIHPALHRLLGRQ